MKTNFYYEICLGLKQAVKTAAYFAAFIIALVAGTEVVAQPTVQTFNSSTTWTCPAGVTSVDVELWGGGGGGGGDGTSNTAGGCGGGSGAYRKIVSVSVTPGNNYTVTVGSGGSGGSGTISGQGGKGGSSSFNGYTAGGGCGGLGNSTSGVGVGGCSGGTTSTCFALGSDCNPSIVIFPNSGSSGSNGETGSSRGGAGGTAPSGGAGGARRTTDGIGNGGTQPGGAGGGAYRTGSFARNGGAGGAGRVRLTYTIPVPPAITGFSPSTGCVGETITISGTNLSGPVSATVGGVAVTGAITTTTLCTPSCVTTVSFTVPAGAITGPITYTTTGGTGTSATDFTVLGSPPTVAPTATPATICDGESSTLAANATAVTGSISTYAWSTGLVGNVSGGSVSPSTNTTYNVTVTTNEGCSASASALVTVNSLPPVATGLSNQERCGNGTVTFSANDPGVGFEVQWSTDGSANDDGTGLSISPAVNVGTPITRYARVRNTTTNCFSTWTSGYTGTANALPTITLGPNPSVIQGITSANLPYSATTGSPDEYSIDWDIAAEGEGFVDLSYTSLGSSPLVLTVPGGAAVATYNATLTVRNTSTTCASNTYNITVTVAAPVSTYIWVGGTLGNLTNWSTPSNWQDGFVPNSCAAEVIIPNTTYKPVLSSTASVGDIEIQSGASLTLNADLTICGDFTGSSTATPALVLGNGTAILTGSSQQTINNRVRFNTLQINNNNVAGNGDVVLAGGAQISVATGLHLQSGDLTTTGGTLTMLSTASNNNSYIDDFTGGYTGTITGNVQIQRYVPTPGYNQHFISSPISSTPLSQISASGPDGSYITPKNDCSKLQSAPGSAYGSVFIYDDVRIPASTCVMANWKIKSSGTMETAKGYSTYLTGNNVLTLTGTPNTGNQQITGVNSGNTYVNLQPLNEPVASGWNLVGNPYPSAITLNSVANDHSGFDNQVQVWQTSGPFSGSWQTLDMASGATIAAFQAFQIHRNSGGNAQFKFYQSERTRATNVNFYRTGSEQSLILEVNYNGIKDLTKIQFNPAATSGFDSEYDANKPGGNVDRPTLYTHLNNNVWYSTNTLPGVEQVAAVPMGLAGQISGAITISAQGIQTFDPTCYIFLEDTKTGTWHNLRNGDYTCNRTATENQNRFVVHFTPPTKILVTDASCSSAGMINIEQPGNANWDYTVTDHKGTTISSGTLSSANGANISTNAGIYNLILTDNSGYMVTKTIEVKGSQPIVANFILGTTTAELNEEINFTATTANATTYQWDFGDGTTAVAKEVYHNYKAEGTYKVHLAVSNATGCQSNTTQLVTITSKSLTNLPNLAPQKPVSIWGSENRIYVDFSGQKKVQAEIEIYNILGQVISHEEFHRTGVYSKEVNYAEAAYVLVWVKNDNEVTTKKVYLTNR